MSHSLNRPAGRRRSGNPSPAAAAERYSYKGSYTDRHDRPRQAPRPEGTYVSGAMHRHRPGRYTDVDGAARGAGRAHGHYTQRG